MFKGTQMGPCLPLFKGNKIFRHISHTYKYFAHPTDIFCLCTNFTKNTNLSCMDSLRIYHVWLLFGVTPGVDSFWRHFGAINK